MKNEFIQRSVMLIESQIERLTKIRPKGSEKIDLLLKQGLELVESFKNPSGFVELDDQLAEIDNNFKKYTIWMCEAQKEK